MSRCGLILVEVPCAVRLVFKLLSRLCAYGRWRSYQILRVRLWLGFFIGRLLDVLCRMTGAALSCGPDWAPWGLPCVVAAPAFPPCPSDIS